MPVLQVRMTDELMDALRSRTPEGETISGYARELLEKIVAEMERQGAEPDRRARIRAAMFPPQVVKGAELPKIAPRR